MYFAPAVRRVLESVLAHAHATAELSAVSRSRALDVAISQVGAHDSSIPEEVDMAAKAVVRRAMAILAQESSLVGARELNAAQLAEMVSARKLQYEPAPPRLPPTALAAALPEVLASADAAALYASRIADRDVVVFEVLDPPMDTGKHVSWRAATTADEIATLRGEIMELRAEIVELRGIVKTVMARQDGEARTAVPE
jgi:hypothetical protein